MQKTTNGRIGRVERERSEKDERISIETKAWLERHEQERKERDEREEREQRDRDRAQAAYIEQNIRNYERMKIASIVKEREYYERLVRDERDEFGRNSLERCLAWEQERKRERERIVAEESEGKSI